MWGDSSIGECWIPVVQSARRKSSPNEKEEKTMDTRTKSWEWRALVASCILILGLGALLVLPCSLAQEKPDSGDIAQINAFSRLELMPFAVGSQRLEISLRPIATTRGHADNYPSIHYFLRAPLFVLSPSLGRSAAFHWAGTGGGSRLAFARSTTSPGTSQWLSSFSLGPTIVPAVNPPTTWNGGAGNWNDSTKWTGGVPTSGTDAFIDGGKTLVASPVTLNIGGAQVGNLTVDSDDSLTFNPSTSLTVNGGTISNGGHIVINGGGGTNSFLNLNSNTSLTGAGTLTLSAATGAGSTFIQQSASGVTLTNQSTIQGTGIIGNGGLAVNNQGTIDANTATGQAAIVLNGSGGVINTSLLEATSGGTLSIQNGVNNSGGNITANGGTVSLAGATIAGGTLNISGGGTMSTAGGAVLDGSTASGAVTINGTYTASNNATTTLLGTITNKNKLQLNGGNGANGFINLGSVSETLQGGGTLALSTIAANGGSAFIQQSVSNVIFTNVDNTIQGEGVIGNGGLALVNGPLGIIDANSTAGPLVTTLTLNGSGGGNGGVGVVNKGLMEATNSGVLLIQNTVTNTGGNITASGAASTVEMNGANITGGTLNTISGGTMDTIGGATLNGVTISSGSTYTASNNAVTHLNGTITNNGMIALNGGGGANGFINLDSNVTLQGGTLTLSAATGSGSAFVQQGASGVTLTNKGTIQGTGIIGNGGLAVNNQGTIDANTAMGQAAIVLNGSGGVTNTSLLEATSGGTLSIQNGVNNAGGNITASGAGSMVQMASANITGGTLSTLSGGTMDTAGGATLNGVTISKGSTYTASNNAVTHLNGTVTNNGTIALNGGGGANGFINLDSNVTLLGGGKLTISTVGGPGSAFIQQGASGVALTNTSNTIQGNGIIGNGGLRVVNGSAGTIDASVSGGALNLNGSGGLTNNGTLRVDSGSLMHVSSGPFTNFAGTTLTGGTYNVIGTLQIDELGSTGDEIVTNAANIILNTPPSSFVDAAGKNALTSFHTNTTGSSFTITGGRNFTTAGNFTNNGTLTSGASNSKFNVNGSLTNFSGTTLTGGVYNLTGTLQFNGANVVTNAASITLTGTSSQIINQTSGNGLANFATNASTGSFTVAGGRILTTPGAFTNNGTLTTTGSGSEFTAGGNFINNKSLSTTGGDGEVATISSASFTNNGTLTVGSGSKFSTGGSLKNFSGTTLTGGIYNLTGTLQFTGANIVTNAANITLTGTSSQIVNQLNANGLANFATNASTGNFTVAGGRALTTLGAFTNNGSLTMTGSGSKFTAGGTATFTNNGTLTTTGSDTSEVATGTGGIFTNKGTLTVGSGSKFSTGGSLTNFSGTTLTGGIYNLSGMLQFTGANVVTNAANISLIGSSSKIVDQTSTTDGLRNFAANSAAGSFSISGGRNFTTTSNFSNAGTLSIGTGSTFTTGGPGNFTQTAGKTTDDGTLSTSGMVSLTGGSLFGKGSIAGALQSSAIITPGDSSTSTGVLAVSKTYTQNSSGVLDISIGGTTAGTKYDQLNISGAANLKGTLNLSMINGFIPTVGTTFEVLNAGSVTGTFSTVNGTAINGSEHFVASCDTTDCDVTVASGAFVASKTNSITPQSYAVTSSRNSKQSIGNSSQLPTLQVRDLSIFRTSPTHSSTKLQLGLGAGASFRAARPANVISDLLGRKPLTAGSNAAFRLVPKPKFSEETTPRNHFALNVVIRRGISGAPTGLPRNARVLGRNGLEYHVNLFSMLGRRGGHDLTSPSGSRFGSLIITNPY